MADDTATYGQCDNDHQYNDANTEETSFLRRPFNNNQVSGTSRKTTSGVALSADKFRRGHGEQTVTP